MVGSSGRRVRCGGTALVAGVALTLVLPAAAGADSTAPIAVSDECVLENPALVNAGALETAVLGMSLAAEELAAATTAVGEDAATNVELSEIESEAALETVGYLEESITLALMVVEATGEEVTRVAGGELASIETIEMADVVSLGISERNEVLGAEIAKLTEAGTDASMLEQAVEMLSAVQTAVAETRELLAGEVDAQVLIAYQAPTQVAVRPLIDVRAFASDRTAEAAAAFAPEASVLATSVAELDAVQADLPESVVEVEVVQAVRDAVASISADVGAVQASMGETETAVLAGRPTGSVVLTDVALLDGKIASVREVIGQVSADLSVVHPDQPVALQDARAAVRSTLEAVSASLVRQAEFATAARTVATKGVSRSALKSFVEPAAEPLTIEVHAANAAVVDAAVADLVALNADAAASELEAVASQAPVASELGIQLQAAASATRSLATAEANVREALAADRAVIARQGRFVGESELLTSSAAAVGDASADLASAHSGLVALKLGAENAEAVAIRNSALASIERTLSGLDAAVASFDRAQAAKGKYQLGKTKKLSLATSAVRAPVVEAPVVREPVVREPVVREPVVREPVVREPVVREPVVREPVVREPVVREPVVRESVASRTAEVAEEAEVREPIQTAVRGALTTRDRYTVVEGTSVSIPIADLGLGESQVTVTLDDLATHGELALVQVGGVCELAFASQPGCLGVQSVDVVVDVDGERLLRTIEFEVVEASLTVTPVSSSAPVTQFESQPPAALAFTGPADTVVFALIGIFLTVIGFTARRFAASIPSTRD